MVCKMISQIKKETGALSLHKTVKAFAGNRQTPKRQEGQNEFDPDTSPTTALASFVQASKLLSAYKNAKRIAHTASHKTSIPTARDDRYRQQPSIESYFKDFSKSTIQKEVPKEHSQGSNISNTIADSDDISISFCGPGNKYKDRDSSCPGSERTVFSNEGSLSFQSPGKDAEESLGVSDKKYVPSSDQNRSHSNSPFVKEQVSEGILNTIKTESIASDFGLDSKQNEVLPHYIQGSAENIIDSVTASEQSRSTIKDEAPVPDRSSETIKEFYNPELKCDSMDSGALSSFSGKAVKDIRETETSTDGVVASSKIVQKVEANNVSLHNSDESSSDNMNDTKSSPQNGTKINTHDVSQISHTSFCIGVRNTAPNISMEKGLTSSSKQEISDIVSEENLIINTKWNETKVNSPGNLSSNVRHSVHNEAEKNILHSKTQVSSTDGEKSLNKRITDSYATIIDPVGVIGKSETEVKETKDVPSPYRECLKDISEKMKTGVKPSSKGSTLGCATIKGMPSCSPYRKGEYNFAHKDVQKMRRKAEVAQKVVKNLMPYYEQNQITSRNLFKLIARNLAHKYMEEHSSVDDDLVKDFVHQYFKIHHVCS